MPACSAPICCLGWHQDCCAPAYRGLDSMLAARRNDTRASGTVMQKGEQSRDDMPASNSLELCVSRSAIFASFRGIDAGPWSPCRNSEMTSAVQYIYCSTLTPIEHHQHSLQKAASARYSTSVGQLCGDRSRHQAGNTSTRSVPSC